MLREYDEMKKEIKNHENIMAYTILKQYKCIFSVVRKILQTKILFLGKLNKTD